MNEIMSQFLTSEVQTVLFALLGIVVVLYLLSIFWAARDARARGFGWAWGSAFRCAYRGFGCLLHDSSPAS